MLFHDGDLRAIRYGGREVLQRVYMAVRDPNWGTPANAISNLEIDARGDSFEIRYTAENREREIHFRWSTHISGSATGEIAWSMEGVALSSFLKNRIGYCVNHPASECAGRPCSVESTDGRIEQGEFPRFVSPHQPFRNMRAIRHEVEPGVTAEVRFSGDVFEMEDQRNWTDASFKIYSTPLELPYPARIEAGTKVAQTVRLSIGGAPRPASGPAVPVRIELLPDAVPLPPIGLGGAGALAFDQDFVRELARLRLGHLRVDLRPGQAGLREALGMAAYNAQALGVGLECAIPEMREEAAGLAEVADACALVRPPIERWLLVGRSADAARRRLGPVSPGALFACGSDANFAELNRNRPDAAACDALWFAVNPQVHAFDDLSMVENLAGQVSVVETARQFAEGNGIFVTPVTLKPRFHAVATQAIDEAPAPDPRQRTWLGAAWTLGSIRYLAGSGAAGLTYYEAVGDGGVMDRTGRFPVFDVFASAGEFAAGEMVLSQSTNPLAIEALVLRKGGRTRILLANFTHGSQPVHLPGRTVEARPAGITSVDLS